MLDSHHRSSLFSHLTWGIPPATQFLPSDFGSSQDLKKDVDICVFLGFMPPVMMEEFVWFASFCWHCQQLLPLFYGTSVRQLWLCQIVSYFPQFSISPFFFFLIKETSHKKISLGLMLRCRFSGAELVNHWSKPWRQVNLISSGMIFWELWKLSGFKQQESASCPCLQRKIVHGHFWP